MTPVTREPLNVLLIEDAEDDERLTLRALRTSGVPMLVRVARDGEQAVRALGLGGVEADLPAPDLVISDLKVPKRRGDEVLVLAREETRLLDVPYVVFSSSDDPNEVSRCLDLGADAYVTKPIDFEDYQERVHGIVSQWLAPIFDRRPSTIGGFLH